MIKGPPASTGWNIGAKGGSVSAIIALDPVSRVDRSNNVVDNRDFGPVISLDAQRVQSRHLLGGSRFLT